MAITSTETGNATASLAASVTQSVQKYFSELKGTEPVNLINLFLKKLKFLYFVQLWNIEV